MAFTQIPALPVLPQWVVDQPIQANIAIESDYEYYAMFRSAADPVAEAINYISLLIGCEWLADAGVLLAALDSVPRSAVSSLSKYEVTSCVS